MREDIMELTYRPLEMRYRTNDGYGTITTSDIDFVILIETAGIRYVQKLYNHVIRYCDDCTELLLRMVAVLTEALEQEKNHFWQNTEAQHKLVLKRIDQAIDYLGRKV